MKPYQCFAKPAVLLALSLIGLACSSPATAHLPTTARFSAQRAYSYICILASDSLQGRRSGLPGGEKAASWIAAQFEEFGLSPGVGDTSFFQNFCLATPIESGPMLLRLLPDDKHRDSLEFEYGRDFVSFAYGGAGSIAGPVVFIGYGIAEPQKGRDDLEGADLKGKIALAIRGAPPGDDAALWSEERYNGYKSSHARDAGAIGYLQVQGERAVQGTIQQQYFRPDLPAFWISQVACDRLLVGTGLTLDSLRARANENSAGYHRELPVQVVMEAHAGVIPEATTRNVLACIPGADPELAHEIILLGAHMDHLGVDAIGRIYNGAEDNASGTATLLELARVLAEDPIPPRRSVYFCAFAGEELGLVGSEQFVSNSPLNLDSVVVMINLDMVGEGGEGVSLGGAMNFPSIWSIWESSLPDSTLSRIRHFKPGDFSDHAPFENIGIPAFSLSSRGEHLHYHHPDDDADLIKPEVLAEVGEVVYRGMRALADYPAPLADPNRLKDYLWQATETVMIGAPLSFKSEDDYPDLILYEAGKSIDASARNRLRKLLVELDQLDSLCSACERSGILKVDSFDNIPVGQRHPAVALGIAAPSLVENEPAIYRTLHKLGVFFVHVPVSRKHAYFGVRGLKKAGRELLKQLGAAPQVIIWEVESLREARQLMESPHRPMIIQLNMLRAAEGDLTLLPPSGDFILLTRQAADNLPPEDFAILAQACAWDKIGVLTVPQEQPARLIASWLKQGFDQLRIKGLLGENLMRFLREVSGRGEGEGGAVP